MFARSWKPIFALVSCLAWIASASASNKFHIGRYLIENWETDDGLPENSATSILQTPDGYLWFGTFNGLVRFDGVHFQVISSANTPGFPGTMIVNLHLDRSSHLWASTEAGMARMDESGWKSIPWTGGIARTFAETSKGEIFVSGFAGGIYRWTGSAFEAIPLPMESNSGYLLALDESDQLLAAQVNSLWLREGKGWREIPVPLADFRLGPGRAGSAWLASTNDLARLENGKIASRERTPAPIQQIWGVNEDSAGNVWIASYTQGLYVKYSDGTWDHFYEDHGLGHGGVRCVAEDREGNRWVGTSGGGIHRFTPARFTSMGKAAGLPERVVKAVLPDREGGLYVGTYGQGVVHWKDGEFRKFGGAHPDTPGRFVYSLLLTAQGKLLAGTHHMGVMELTEESWSSFAKLGEKDEVFELYEDRSGGIWIGANSGLFRARAGSMESYPLTVGTNATNIRDVTEAPSGRVYVATMEGLAVVDGEKLRLLSEWTFGPAMCIYIESESVVWAGSRDFGLIRLEGGRARVFGPNEGIPGTAGAVVPDAAGNLWISSNRGVVRLERPEFKSTGAAHEPSARTQAFDLADGLPSVECPVGYGSTAARGESNQLWFATLKGVARIDPGALKLNSQPPPVYIEEVHMDERVAAVHKPGLRNETAPAITIPAGTRRIEIGYVALCLSAPQKVAFQTRIDNLDKDWQDVGARRTAYFQDLRPGDYRFHVRAANNDGVWNEEGAALAFTVLPFFHETWWFRLGAIGGLSGLGWLGFRRVVQNRVKRQVERVRQQAALSDLQARLAMVLENTADVVSFATPQGNLLFLNGSGRRLLGLAADAPVAALRLADLHPARARARMENEALPAAIANGLWQGETMLQSGEGAELPVSQLILAHRHGDGSIDFISAIARDISDARRAEEARSGLEKQLRAAQKMDALGTLAGGIAHDFNNILTGILGNAELLRFTLPQDEATQQQVGSIIRASARARDLIRQMLAFGRPQESGLAPVRIWPAVQEAIVLLRASIPASVEIIPECADDTSVAMADTVQIHQLVMNLGANAAHAMADKGGQLRIRQEVAEIAGKDLQAHPKLAVGKWIKIMVSDTGCGMAPETLERIFEPFFTTKALGQGTGLGLAVVHGIARGHNGVVEVRSAVNLGTTFDLYFPLATDLEAAPPTARTEISRGGGERILFVDDEDLVLKVGAKFLEQLGYQCKPFGDPVEALIHFQSHSREYDLLLTDLSMPRLSGTGLATAIREIRPNFPVVLSTGFSGRLKAGEAQRSGVKEILSKPYRMDELAQSLRRALGK